MNYCVSGKAAALNDVLPAIVRECPFTFVMKKFKVENPSDLKTFTDEHYPQGSFAFAALLRARDIRVNGVRTSKNVPLHVGDEVTYFTLSAQEAKPSHNVIFEAENVCVCDKFSGVSTEGLASELNFNGSYFAVHRLDRNTSGVIIFAKNAAAKAELEAAFKEHRAHKTYLALCKNCFSSRGGVLTAYLFKDEKSATVRISDVPRAGYLRIVTEYQVEETMGDIALVKLALHTGRTHQIRAQMAHIGCPVLGDEKYGDQALNKKYGARRQRLVSASLSVEGKGVLAYLSGRVFTSSFTPTA